MKKFLVGVADVYGYDNDDNLLFVGKTVLDSSIETTLQNSDVRAGKGNQLQYIYYHSAEMNVNISEAQFSLEFLALNVGSPIVNGAKVWEEETVEVTGGKGSVVNGIPLQLSSKNVYGWVTLPDGKVERVTFEGSSFTLSDGLFNGNVCVRYYTHDDGARQIVVNADMLPSTIRLVMDATLASSDSTTNKIGSVEIDIPRASMAGSFTLNLTPDNTASTPLTVRALATTENAGGCAGKKSIYATITEHIYDSKWYDGVTALAIGGGDFSLAPEATKKLSIYAIKNDGSAPFLAPLNDLTITSSKKAQATVEGNVVTGVASGETTIKASITAKPEIDANVICTVTA